MAILYDWYENPGESDDSEEKGLHPRIFLNGKVGTDKLCQMIHGRSSLSVGDVKNAFEMLAQICGEELREAKLYFAGDTALFGDMQLLQRLDAFDYAILPIGDNFTMGPEDAAIAAEFLRAEYVIPVHYNTWPLIAQDPVKFKKAVEESTKSKVLIVAPGESIELK